MVQYNFSPRTNPFDHQVEAIDYIQSKSEVALFDEQGLGKTKIVLDAIINNIKQKVIDGGLIICRKNLIRNWEEEIETHSYLKSIVLRGTPREKGMKFMGFTHFYIINYESVPSELERLTAFLQVRKMAIVLDESHAIKNPKAKSTEAILKLSQLSEKRIIVSGTPVANKPEDIWSQYYFLDSGKLLGDNFQQFKRKYKVNLKDEEAIVSGELNELMSLVSENSIRRMKSNVLKLPEKEYVDVLTDLSPIQRDMYDKLKEALAIEIQDIKGKIILDESSALLKRMLRLAQIASNPRLIDHSYEESPGKFLVLDQLVMEILARNEKVIIWSSFVDNIRWIRNKYQGHGAVMVYGHLTIEQRNKSIDKFKNDSACKILVANPAAAKEGLTLTVANNAIYQDRNFNLVDYLQSQDRIHRISQTKRCKIYKLISIGTIDEYIDEILKRKHYVAGVIQGDKPDPQFSKTFSKEEIISYLG